jgi:hypothetical protein
MVVIGESDEGKEERDGEIQWCTANCQMHTAPGQSDFHSLHSASYEHLKWSSEKETIFLAAVE